MKTKILLVLLMLSVGLAGYSTTWQITNSGFTFSPSTVTIQQGDNVNFILSSFHDALEVSAVTWAANGTISNGGFVLSLGGGLVSASQLTVGTHYFVCTIHASLGMKGTIVVVGSTAVVETAIPLKISVAPNPVSDFVKITVNENELLGSTYYLFNQVGREIMTGKLNDKITTLSVSQLPSGVYFMQIPAIQNKPFKLLVNK